jgi:hypothetical protein
MQINVLYSTHAQQCKNACTEECGFIYCTAHAPNNIDIYIHYACAEQYEVIHCLNNSSTYLLCMRKTKYLDIHCACSNMSVAHAQTAVSILPDHEGEEEPR